GEPRRVRLSHRGRASLGLAGPDRDLPGHHQQEGARLMAVQAAVRPAVRVAVQRRRGPRPVLQGFLVAMCAVWLFPLLWSVYEALRPISDTTLHGYVSLPHQGLTLGNFTSAWTNAELPHFYLNTLLVAVPGVIVTLLVASMLAFAISQFS